MRPHRGSTATSSPTATKVVPGKGRFTAMGSLVKNAVYPQITKEELELLAVWEEARPESIRDFDQIPMQGMDLLCQVKLIAPLLAGKIVVFVGDYDGTSMLLGLLSEHGSIESPAQMTLLDFDDRLLEIARTIANEHGFSDRFAGRLYNIFDSVPKELVGSFDAFYTNPPYGASNAGASARLFIARGSELVDSEKASGYALLPIDEDRQWTRAAMFATQRFLGDYGWSIAAQLPQLHRYHLDDDAALMSSLLRLEREAVVTPTLPMPYQGRAVGQTEIPYFYGRGVFPPFPKYVAGDGREITALPEVE